MNVNDIPFNISLLDNSKQAVANLLPVQVLDIYDNQNQFNIQGFYSTAIFGDPGSKERQTKFSYLDMRTDVMHPKIFKELSKLKGLYEGIASSKAYAVWDESLKDFVKSDIIDGQTGYAFFVEHFKEIVHTTNSSAIRDLRVELLDKCKDACMYRYLLVIPAGLRDLEINENGRPTEDEINLLYRKALRSANTINAYTKKENDPVLNTVRWNLQTAFNEIYEYIENIISGKRGFILSKWAARNVHGSTRNVITACDPAPKVLGAPDAIGVNDVLVGLHQYLKSTTEISIFDIRNGPMQPVIQNMPQVSYVVDPKTLKRTQITPSKFTIDNWGSETGIEKLINGFAKLDATHKPIMIDGYYAALVYRDDKHFKVVYDIDEVPSHYSRHNIKPITWIEMFYLSVYETASLENGFFTRYPIESAGSIIPVRVRLQTTVVSEKLVRLSDSWNPIANDDKAIAMPILGKPRIDSMSIHPSRLPALSADHDGDKCNLTLILSEEGRKEINEYHKSKEAYIDPIGGVGLKTGINNKNISMALYNLTHFGNLKLKEAV